ncbi:MAG: hypothetical protein F6K65_10160 [Moorea sp. SIO3C2]|nr:hypothetical protein [Moorena sp. SIO3C2]
MRYIFLGNKKQRITLTRNRDCIKTRITVFSITKNFSCLLPLASCLLPLASCLLPYCLCLIRSQRVRSRFSSSAFVLK